MLNVRLDIENSRIKTIEEIYLGIQLILVFFSNLVFHHLSKGSTCVQIKFFLSIYGIYIFALVFLFVHKVFFKNDENIRPNLYLSFIDGLFLSIFLYLADTFFYSIFHLFYIYITLQTIRFYNKASLFFSSFVSICYTILIIIKDPKALISLEFFINISSFYLLSYVLSSIIKEIHHLETRVHFILEEIQKKNIILNEIATKDYLTNMYNHKSFYKYLKDIIKGSREKDVPFGLALMDIDNFKKINDTYGHLVGDTVLKEISHIIHSNIRKTDIAARYGGEEFAILFPNASIDTSVQVCERIREAIETHSFIVDEHTIKVTISGGAGSAIIYNSSSKERNFVEYVDNLLYDAKHAGKNRIHYSKEIIYLK